MGRRGTRLPYAQLNIIYTSEGEFYVHRRLCQFIEPVTFAPCAFICVGEFYVEGFEPVTLARCAPRARRYTYMYVGAYNYWSI